ncbi:MAG: hypothetical protein J6J36_06635 [Clostridia bacterium]|nr:hypothetical protein [Clostridia bacterium]
MDYNKIYEELQLADNYNAILKLDLYCQIRKYVQDTEFDSSFIDELFEFWLYVNENYYQFDYSINDFVQYLENRTAILKIDLKNIDLDECAKEYEEE